MRGVAALLTASLVLIATASATPLRPPERGSTEAVLGWINYYRTQPNPAAVPTAIQTLVRTGGFKDPESAGVYVGFLAGVLNANPARAEELVDEILPLPPEHQWVVVRAIAYSGLPNWKGLLHGFAMHMPGRKAMIDRYLRAELPTLEHLAFKGEDPGLLDRLRNRFRKEPDKQDQKTLVLEPTPDLIDTLWGFYFGTGAYPPIGRIIAMLPWSNDDNDVEKLTLGGMAKYTLATNAARDPELLAMLKWASKHQPEETQPILADVIDAAEAVDTGRIRKEALAAIEELKRKGPGYRRRIASWGQIGQGALSLGCIGAAVAGATALGLPCVIGGAVSSAALNYWGTQQ